MTIKYDLKRGKKIAFRALKVLEKRYDKIRKEKPWLIPEYIDFYKRETLAVGKVGKYYPNVSIIDLRNGRLFKALPEPLDLMKVPPKILKLLRKPSELLETPIVIEAFLQTNPTYKTMEDCIKQFLFKDNWQFAGEFCKLGIWEFWREDFQGLFDRLRKEEIKVKLYQTKEGYWGLRLSPK